MTFARFVEKHKLGNIQRLEKGNAQTRGEFNIPTKLFFVQYMKPLSEDRDGSDGVDLVLGSVRLRWCQTPGVEHNLLPRRVCGLFTASSINGVVDMVQKRSVLTSCTKSSKLKEEVNGTPGDSNWLHDAFYDNRSNFRRGEQNAIEYGYG